MKKTILCLLIAGLLFSACDTGIKPNVPSENIIEPIATKTESDARAVEAVSEGEGLEEGTAEEPVAENENTTSENTTNDTTNEQPEEVTDVESNEDETEAELSAEEDAVFDESKETAEGVNEAVENPVDLPVIQPVVDTPTLPVVTLPVVTDKASVVNETRAIWLSYLELQRMLGSGESYYRNEIKTVMTNAKALGLNTIYFQVRPFGDALYQSSLFPSSYLVTGTEGQTLTYDPLQIAIEAADENGLRIEAWINPYRVRNASSKIPLSSSNIAKTWLNDESRRVLQTEDGIIIYNPALEEVRTRIVAGVKEILDHYAVDGIHFDDYFYPTTDMSFDEIEYFAFTYDDDSKSQEEFRRQNVNKLITEVYDLVHSYNRNLVFGVSPQGVIDTNYNQLYVDIPLWLSAPGYVDYICPQIYYGFDHERTPFDTTLDSWHALVKNDVKVIAGLAAYKIGATDKWAGTGKEEWVTSERLLQRMIEASRMDTYHGGYALYRYDFLFNPSDELIVRVDDEIKGVVETQTE